MVLGIILITIGLIGSIVTLIYGIKFMKKNNIIFKSDYVELVREATVEDKPIKKVKKEKHKTKKETKKKYEEADGTELLDEEVNIATGNVSLDTELLDLGGDTDILIDEVVEKSKIENKNNEDTMILEYENNGSDTELLM